MSVLEQLENSLNNIFVKKVPQLPEGGKKFLVQYLPWINLVLGIITLWTAWMLWNWAHTINALVNYTNNLSVTYGSGTIGNSRMSMGIWLGVLVLAVEGVLYIAAYPGTRDHKKSGWNFLFYALLINIIYGIVIVFTSYGTFGNLLSYVVGSAIGLYFLFQIRSSYSDKPAPAHVVKPKAAEKE